MSRKNAPLQRRNLPLLLLQAREHVIAYFRPLLNEHGLTEQQWRIIRVLLDRAPLEPRQIGELCRISSPSLAGVLARMEEMGLIRRERVPSDLRRVTVSLTPASRAIAATLAPRIEAIYQRIETLIGAEFSARFHQALDQLIGALADPSEASSPPAPQR